MADAELILEVDGRDVQSTVSHVPSSDGRTVFQITSRCEGHLVKTSHSIHHRTGYTAQQAEYDLEQARWIAAQAVAGKAHVHALVRTLLPAKGQDSPTRRLSQPEVQRPVSSESNAKVK